MSDQKDEFKQSNKDMNYILSVGFYGGLFTSLVAYLAYALNFVPYGPGIILQMVPIYESTWVGGIAGQLLSIIVISLFSIISSYVYYLLFRQLDSPWVGVCYGIAWWGLIFLGVNQLIPGIQSVGKLGLTTNIVFLSIFILYGVFVGYSISFHHKEQQIEGKT